MRDVLTAEDPPGGHPEAHRRDEHLGRQQAQGGAGRAVAVAGLEEVDRSQVQQRVEDAGAHDDLGPDDLPALGHQDGIGHDVEVEGDEAEGKDGHRRNRPGEVRPEQRPDEGARDDHPPGRERQAQQHGLAEGDAGELLEVIAPLLVGLDEAW